MNKIFYLLLSPLFISFTFGMHTPLLFLKDAIASAANSNEAASICNKAAEEGLILPTQENMDWCINAFGYKAYKEGLCSFAHKLHSFNTTNWLEQYLKTEQGLAWASLDLGAAIRAKNESLVAFILSTKNSQLVNSITRSWSPTELARRIEDKPEILLSFLNAGFTTDHRWNTGIVTSRVLESHWALIHSAAYAGCPKITRILLEYGSDVNLSSIEDASVADTPLIILAKTDFPMHQSHLETAKILLASGADTKILSKSENKKASELADPNNIGGIRRQLKELIQTHEQSQTLT